MTSRILLLLITAGLVTAQVSSDYAYLGDEATGMAGAVTAHPGPFASLFHNPAGLTDISDWGASAGQANLFGFSWLPFTYAGVVWPTRRWGNMGLSAQSMKVEYGGNTLSQESAFSFSHGFYLQHDVFSSLAVGYTIHYYGLDYGSSAGPSGTGDDGIDLGNTGVVSMDLGVQAGMRDRHFVGAYLKNINRTQIGTAGAAQDLPRRLSVGVAYVPYDGTVTTLVLDQFLGKEPQWKGGISLELGDWVTLRLGIQSNPNRMGGGLEFRFKHFRVGYSALTHHVLPVTQQISLSYFGKG